MPLQKQYRIKDAAEKLSVTPKTIRNWIKLGLLEAVHATSRCILISENALQRFVDVRGRKG